jgi:hypothetical protein
VPLALEKAAVVAEELTRVAYLLEDLGEEDQVELAVAEDRRDLVDVGGVDFDDLVEKSPCPLDLARVSLEPDHVRPGQPGDRPVETESATHVEHRMRTADRLCHRHVGFFGGFGAVRGVRGHRGAGI